MCLLIYTTTTRFYCWCPRPQRYRLAATLSAVLPPRHKCLAVDAATAAVAAAAAAAA